MLQFENNFPHDSQEYVNAEPFTLFYTEFFPQIEKIAIVFFTNPEVAHDIASETFLAAFVGFDKVKNSQTYTPRQYLLGIFNHKKLDYMRRMYRKPDGDNLNQHLVDRSPGPEEDVISKELEYSILSALSMVSENHARLLQMKYLQDMSYQEMSDILQISVPNLKGQLVKARESLKRVMVREKIEY